MKLLFEHMCFHGGIFDQQLAIWPVHTLHQLQYGVPAHTRLLRQLNGLLQVTQKLKTHLQHAGVDIHTHTHTHIHTLCIYRKGTPKFIP